MLVGLQRTGMETSEMKSERWGITSRYYLGPERIAISTWCLLIKRSSPSIHPSHYVNNFVSKSEPGERQRMKNTQEGAEKNGKKLKSISHPIEQRSRVCKYHDEEKNWIKMRNNEFKNSHPLVECRANWIFKDFSPLPPPFFPSLEIFVWLFMKRAALLVAHCASMLREWKLNEDGRIKMQFGFRVRSSFSHLTWNPIKCDALEMPSASRWTLKSRCGRPGQGRARRRREKNLKSRRLRREF